MLNQDFPLRNVLVALPRPPLPAFARRLGPVGRHFRLIFSSSSSLSLPTTKTLQSSKASSNFFFLLFSLVSRLWPLELLLLSNPREKKEKNFTLSLPPLYPRKSDRLPKFPFDLFRLEPVEQNVHRGIHRDPTGLARRKRLKDAGLEDARGAVLKGKEER